MRTIEQCIADLEQQYDKANTDLANLLDDVLEYLAQYEDLRNS